MNLPIFINKWILGFAPIRYTPFYTWFRLLNHSGFRFDDYYRYLDFWTSLSYGWYQIEYKKLDDEYDKIGC